MTPDERVQAVIDFGFTERQARFLVLVLRHAGVWVPRQYASFGAIANGGRRCNAFFDKLVRRGYANENGCVHNRARLYHLPHKPLYHVIGEVTSRYRRRVSPRLAIERLILLDAVLTMPNLEWLTTAAQKAAYLATLITAAGADALREQPAGDPSGTAPQLWSTFPIGLEPDGRAILLYLATDLPAENNASALIFELARAGLIEACVSPAILEEYADALGDQPEFVADKLSRASPSAIR